MQYQYKYSQERNRPPRAAESHYHLSSDLSVTWTFQLLLSLFLLVVWSCWSNMRIVYGHTYGSSDPELKFYQYHVGFIWGLWRSELNYMCLTIFLRWTEPTNSMEKIKSWGRSNRYSCLQDKTRKISGCFIFVFDVSGLFTIPILKDNHINYGLCPQALSTHRQDCGAVFMCYHCRFNSD